MQLVHTHELPQMCYLRCHRPPRLVLQPGCLRHSPQGGTWLLEVWPQRWCGGCHCRPMALRGWDALKPASLEGCSGQNKFGFYCRFVIENRGRVNFAGKSTSAREEPMAELQLPTFKTSKSCLFKKENQVFLPLVAPRQTQMSWMVTLQTRPAFPGLGDLLAGTGGVLRLCLPARLALRCCCTV